MIHRAVHRRGGGGGGRFIQEEGEERLRRRRTFPGGSCASPGDRLCIVEAEWGAAGDSAYGEPGRSRRTQ